MTAQTVKFAAINPIPTTIIKSKSAAKNKNNTAPLGQIKVVPLGDFDDSSSSNENFPDPNLQVEPLSPNRQTLSPRGQSYMPEMATIDEG